MTSESACIKNLCKLYDAMCSTLTKAEEAVSLAPSLPQGAIEVAFLIAEVFGVPLDKVFQLGA